MIKVSIAGKIHSHSMLCIKITLAAFSKLSISPNKFTLVPGDQRNPVTICCGWVILNKMWTYRG